jgi:hypothetical protein
MIRLRADAVHTLQTQAQDYLDMTFPDAPILPYALRESTDKTYYHLMKPLIKSWLEILWDRVLSPI